MLRPDSAPELTDLDQKLELLEASGVDTVVVVPFDPNEPRRPPRSSSSTSSSTRLRAKAVVVGHDFHFGKNCDAGNVDVLTKLGIEHDFVVEGIQLPSTRRQGRPCRRPPSGEHWPVVRCAPPPHCSGATMRSEVWSSAAINEVAPSGSRQRTWRSIARASQAGRRRVCGLVTQRPDGTRHPAAINIGKRPTFYQEAEHSLVEAHLIGFGGDLYGELARVQFVELIRSEQRFDGIEALKAQLDLDIAKAIDILARDEQS
ncbi:MAG: riboflavin kinase [Acidimicrobiales bacterium]